MIEQQKMSEVAWQEMASEFAVVEKSRNKLKVAADSEGNLYKCYYRPSFFSKRFFANEAKKFAENSEMLRALGIDAPDVRQLIYVDRVMTVAVYPKLPGFSVRQLWNRNELNDDYSLMRLASFIGHLHDKGIYFRGLHVGNILFYDDQFSLLDVSDVQFLGEPLKRTQRVRNFKPLLRYIEDQNALGKNKMRYLLSCYEDSSGFDACDF